jgi:hypothetical protein
LGLPVKEGGIRKVEPLDLYLAENVFALRIKCCPSNVGTAIMARLSPELVPRKSSLAGLLFVYGCSSAGQAGYDRTLSFCGFLCSREGPGLSVSKQYDT